MELKYKWKELTGDGLMKEPEDVGPYYSKESLNGWWGFDTEEEAIKELERMKEAHKYSFNGDYVLVKIY